jgi:hypothetical protein
MNSRMTFPNAGTRARYPVAMSEIKPKSNRGGKRPGAGRKPGSPSAATQDQKATVRALARAYTETAVNVLVRVCRKSESDAARVAAANSILDRGWGRPGIQEEPKVPAPVQSVVWQPSTQRTAAMRRRLGSRIGERQRLTSRLRAPISLDADRPGHSRAPTRHGETKVRL